MTLEDDSGNPERERDPGVLGAKLKNRNLVLTATGFSLKMEVRFKNDIIKTALEKK